jgi:predicted TIM-barrel fold metal-dependent hydrolase
MRVIDVDGHFHEPVDWLVESRPDLAAELPPPPRFMETLSVAQRAMSGALPEDFTMPENPLDLMTAEFRAHCEKADALQPDHYDPDSHDPLYRGDGRIALCDEVGIDVQWLSPTFDFGVIVQAMMNGRADLVPSLRGAWNTWAAQQVEGFSDRLQPITQANVSDIDWTIAEMTRMRANGSRAFHIDQHPTKSLTHPDFEPMWSAAEDLGMAAYVHVMFGQPPRHSSWVNNGRGVKAFTEGPSTADEMRAETRKLLTAMVFDGVFARHPDLRVVLAETGISWLPSYLQEIDFKTSTVGMDGLPQANFYRLPLLPSEYILRHVRVAQLIGFAESGLDYMSLTEAFERLPDPDLIVFSSDFPHVEGRANAVQQFERYLPEDPKIRERFYGGSMADFLVGI